jgi:hypothetical protein
MAPIRIGWLAAYAWLAIEPASAKAGTVQSIATAPSLSTKSADNANLDTLANFFVPANSIRTMVMTACSTALHTALANSPQEADMEKAMPGLHDAMTQASLASCTAEFDVWLKSKRLTVQTYWRSQLPPADIGRIAGLVGESVVEVQSVAVVGRQGETMKDSLDRAMPPKEDWTARFEAKQKAFAKTPGGVRLLNLVAAYQLKTTEQLKNRQSGPIQIIINGNESAHRAGNAYAKARGYGPLYVER